jgi:hypothetical protein
MTATSSLVPGRAFEDLNKADALRCAAAGAARARRAGLDAEERATIAPPTWQGIVDVADELDAQAPRGSIRVAEMDRCACAVEDERLRRGAV